MLLALPGLKVELARTPMMPPLVGPMAANLYPVGVAMGCTIKKLLSKMVFGEIGCFRVVVFDVKSNVVMNVALSEVMMDHLPKWWLLSLYNQNLVMSHKSAMFLVEIIGSPEDADLHLPAPLYLWGQQHIIPPMAFRRCLPASRGGSAAHGNELALGQGMS